MGFVLMRAEEVHSKLGRSPGYAPVAICDVCEGLIQDGDLAMYCFDQSQVKMRGATTEIFIVHKGPCREEMEGRIGRKNYGDLEYSDLLKHLTHNAGLGDERE